MHYLITGGYSDVARTTIDQLLASGHRVSWSGPAFRPSGGGRVQHVSHGDAPWRDVDFRAVDGIIHLAGPHPANHLGEQDIARQRLFAKSLFGRAADAGIPRIFFLSVVSNPRVRDLPFVQAKYAVEEELKQTGLPAVVFRIPWLYGPNDDFLTRLWRWVRSRSVLLVPGLLDVPVQLCHERKLAAAIVQAIGQSTAQLRVFEVATSSPLPLSELINQLGLLVRGESPRIVPVSNRAFHLRGPLRVVGLIPIRSPMWALLEGGLTCATTAFERNFDVEVQQPNSALIEFVREMGGAVPWWGRRVGAA